MRPLCLSTSARRRLVDVLLLTPLAVRAQIVEHKLAASDGSKADRFGVSVAVSGDVAIVGAHWDEDNGLVSGSAYVFGGAGGQWVEA